MIASVPVLCILFYFYICSHGPALLYHYDSFQDDSNASVTIF